MKNKSLIITAVLSISLCTFSFAQTNKEAKDQAKAQETKDKELKENIKERATRSARREARNLKKQGYQTPAGALPLEKQLDEAWMKQYEKDSKGFPVWFVANATITGENYEAAKNSALNLAKVELAGLISTNVAGWAENSVANQDLSKEEAASLVKTVDASKNIIAQELGRVLPILEVYKTLQNKNVQVQLRIAYNIAMANDVAKSLIRNKLEKETGIAHDKLEKLMGLDFNNVKTNSNVDDPESE